MFVLAALIIVAVTIGILGGGDLFNTKDRCIIYFDESVKGLYVGSAVSFHGVEIGRVTNIGLIFNPVNNSSEVPVRIDLEPNRVSGLGGPKEERLQRLQTMIDQGLRAQLAPDSLLANTEIITLDFFPGTKANYKPNAEPYLQIPSIPSTLQQLQSELSMAVQHLPALADTLNATVKNLNDLLSPENRQHASAILANVDTISGTLAAHQADVGDAVAKLDRSSQQLAALTTNLNQMMSEDRAPLKTAINNIAISAQSLGKVSDQLNAMLAEDRPGLDRFSNGTLYQVSGLVADTRRMVHRANSTLDELQSNPSGFLFSTKSQGIPAK
jgi:paraquat-inducible protein B